MVTLKRVSHGRYKQFTLFRATLDTETYTQLRNAHYMGMLKNRSGVLEMGPHAVAILLISRLVPEPQRTSALQFTIFIRVSTDV